MGTNAERQAAWRARRERELKQLRRAATAAPAAGNAPELERLRRLVADLSNMNGSLTTALAAEKEKVKALRAEKSAANGWTPADASFSRGERFKRLLQLCHPDRHNGSRVAHETTVWLNRLRRG
jgi:hypothetical protein